MLTHDVIESIDEYCKRLWKALHNVPSSERDDLIREVRSHILERVEAEPKVTPEVLTKILRAVGEPKVLAAEYRTQVMLREATRKDAPWVLRPWVLLRATLRWAVTSMAGLIAFVATVIGYGCSAVFLICAVLKPLLPSRIGLWLAPQHTLSLGYWNGRISGSEVYGISVRPPISFVLGTLGATEGPVRELLGNWFIPVSILCGALFFVATSLVARWLIGKFTRKKKKWNASLRYATSMTQSGLV